MPRPTASPARVRPPALRPQTSKCTAATVTSAPKAESRQNFIGSFSYGAAFLTLVAIASNVAYTYVALLAVFFAIANIWHSAAASGGLRPWAIHQLVEYRAMVLVCFACPVSFVLWAISYARARYAEAHSTPAEHEKRVEQVSAQVRAWSSQPASERKPMCTSRANFQNLSTRFVNKDILHKIRLSHLRDVLEVRASPGEQGTVLVEPNVTVGYICRKLAPTHMLAVSATPAAFKPAPYLALPCPETEDGVGADRVARLSCASPSARLRLRTPHSVGWPWAWA